MTPELMQSLLPAVFGLTGVVVGGVITAGTNYWLARRQETRDEALRARKEAAALHQGARLLSNELQDVRATLHADLKGGRPEAFVRIPITLESWDKYQAVLTSHLPEPSWSSVTTAISVIKAMRTMQGVPFAEDAVEDATTVLRAAIPFIDSALEALSPLTVVSASVASQASQTKSSLFSRVRSRLRPRRLSEHHDRSYETKD